MSAVRMIEMDWSPVARFKNMPVPTVEETSDTRFFTKRRTTLVRLSNMRLATMEPPKHMEHMMSQIVLSIPAIPPVLTNSLRESLPVSTLVAPKKVIANPFTTCNAPGMSFEAAISFKMSDWKMMAQMPANIEETKRTTNDGIRLAIMIPVMIGTISVKMEMLKVAESPLVNSETCKASELP